MPDEKAVAETVREALDNHAGGRCACVYRKARYPDMLPRCAIGRSHDAERWLRALLTERDTLAAALRERDEQQIPMLQTVELHKAGEALREREAEVERLKQEREAEKRERDREAEAAVRFGWSDAQRIKVNGELRGADGAVARWRAGYSFRRPR